MGIATSYHQVLRTQCFPLRSIRPTVSTHRYSAPIRGKLCRIRPSPDAKPGRTPPFPCASISPCFDDFARSDSFRLFRLFGIPPTITHSSPFLIRYTGRRQLCTIWSSEATIHKCFECGCRQHRCRRILGCFACTITCSL